MPTWMNLPTPDASSPGASSSVSRLVVSAQVIAEDFSAMRRNGREMAWIERNALRMLKSCPKQPLAAVLQRP